MKKELSKIEAAEAINEFFNRKDWTSEEMRKIRRIAMKYRIRLGKYKREFCKKCLSKLKGRTRISKGYKIVECSSCSYNNKAKI